MQHRTKRIATAALVAAGIAAGTGFVVAAGGDDDDTETPITGDDLRRATAAALAHTGGGEVTGTEVGDEESRYEVEGYVRRRFITSRARRATMYGWADARAWAAPFVTPPCAPFGAP